MRQSQLNFNNQEKTSHQCFKKSIALKFKEKIMEKLKNDCKNLKERLKESEKFTMESEA